MNWLLGKFFLFTLVELIYLSVSVCLRTYSIYQHSLLCVHCSFLDACVNCCNTSCVYGNFNESKLKENEQRATSNMNMIQLRAETINIIFYFLFSWKHWMSYLKTAFRNSKLSNRCFWCDNIYRNHFIYLILITESYRRSLWLWLWWIVN